MALCLHVLSTLSKPPLKYNPCLSKSIPLPIGANTPTRSHEISNNSFAPLYTPIKSYTPGWDLFHASQV